MEYPHHVRVYVSTPGPYDEETGEYGAPTIETRYEGPGDVQDEGAVLERDESGTVTLRSDAVLFLDESIADPSVLGAELNVDILWNPVVIPDWALFDWDNLPADADHDDAETLKFVRLDTKLHLRYV